MELIQPKYEIGQNVYYLCTQANYTVVEGGKIIKVIDGNEHLQCRNHRYNIAIGNGWTTAKNEGQLYLTIEEAEQAIIQLGKTPMNSIAPDSAFVNDVDPDFVVIDDKNDEDGWINEMAKKEDGANVSAGSLKQILDPDNVPFETKYGTFYMGVNERSIHIRSLGYYDTKPFSVSVGAYYKDNKWGLHLEEGVSHFCWLPNYKRIKKESQEICDYLNEKINSYMNENPNLIRDCAKARLMSQIRYEERYSEELGRQAERAKNHLSVLINKLKEIE